MRRRRGADRPECRRQVVEGGAAGRYDGEWDTKFSCHEPSISAWVRQEPSQLRRQVRQITMEQGLRTRTAVSTRITRIRLAFGTRCEAMGVQPSIGTVDDAYDGTMARWQKAFSLGGNASRSTAGLGKQKRRPGEQSSRGLGLVAACIVVTTALASVRRTISKGAYELSQASPMSSNPTTCFKKVKLSGQWGTFNASQCCCYKLQARQRNGRSASKQVGHSA